MDIPFLWLFPYLLVLPLFLICLLVSKARSMARQFVQSVESNGDYHERFCPPYSQGSRPKYIFNIYSVLAILSSILMLAFYFVMAFTDWLI